MSRTRNEQRVWEARQLLREVLSELAPMSDVNACVVEGYIGAACDVLTAALDYNIPGEVGP